MVKQQRAARTRRSLVRAAAEVFAREGFVMASLTTIARTAGVSNGALHFHFASKGALARAVEEEAADALRTITDATAMGPHCALQRLVDASHWLLHVLTHDAVMRAGFQLSGAPRGSSAEPADLRGQWRRWVEGVMSEAEREGGLAPDVPARDAALVVVAATTGFQFLATRDSAWGSRTLLSRYWTLMLPGLASAAVLGELTAQGTRPAADGSGGTDRR